MDYPPTLSSSASAPNHQHALGPVADDWEAAEAWLRAIGNRSRRNSPQTVSTYRQHLAKLRWYCENVSLKSPSVWSVADVDAFIDFLKLLPVEALCGKDVVTGRFANVDEAGYTPFRCAPSASSRSDIQRCIHAMFKAWREVGYIHINPMGLHGAGTVRKINTNRAVTLDLFELVLETIEAESRETFEQRQKAVRDTFVFIALRELGLRATEFVKATMGALRRLSNPKDGKTYWIMHVEEHTAKGRVERKIPVTNALFHALMVYREAFGMSHLPSPDEITPLLLSPRTQRNAKSARGNAIKSAESRRFFGAWRSVTSRHGLYSIVKSRLAQTARFLESVGDLDRSEQILKASPHWLRHTFAKSALLKGQSVREVASLLGHASVGTTMIYTDQDAIDLVMAMERASPGSVAADLLIKA